MEEPLPLPDEMIIFRVVCVEKRLDESLEVHLQTVELTPVQDTVRSRFRSTDVGKLCRASICFQGPKTTEMAELASGLLSPAHFDLSVKDGSQRQLSSSPFLLPAMTIYSLLSSVISGALRVVETILLSILKVARWLWIQAHL